MKISIGRVLDAIFDESKAFSLSRLDDVYVYNYRSSGLTFSERKNALEKTKSYMGPMLVHLIMYCFPDKHSGGKETIKSNERELINKYLLKISKAMLEHKKLTPPKLEVKIDKSFLGEIKNELKKHDYSQLNFDCEDVEDLQYIFLIHWADLIKEKLVKHDKNITYNELSEMLEEMKDNVLESLG